jgi:hypothetical protein
MYKRPKNLTPWRDSNPVSSDPQADAMTTQPGVDVMIAIFCDFCQFSAQKWRFSQKPML